MGQSASKAASRVSTRISQAASQQPPARPDPITGFTRGQGPKNPRDEEQRVFLENHSPQGVPKEMPADLLKFLNDAGPLKRQGIDSESTNNNISGSKRLPRIPGIDHQELDRSQEQDFPQPHSDPLRVRQVMPLMSDLQDYGTERTTSFSYKKDESDPRDFGIDILDMYRLVQNNDCNQQGLDASHAAEFYQQALKGRDTSFWDEKQREQHKLLLQQARKYIEAPVILKDEDNSYVGAFVRDVPRLNFLKLKVMPENTVKLVLQDLIDSEEVANIEDPIRLGNMNE